MNVLCLFIWVLLNSQTAHGPKMDHGHYRVSLNNSFLTQFMVRGCLFKTFSSTINCRARVNLAELYDEN